MNVSLQPVFLKSKSTTIFLSQKDKFKSPQGTRKASILPRHDGENEYKT